MIRSKRYTASMVVVAAVAVATCAMASGDYSTKTAKGEHYKAGVKYRPAVTVGHETTARMWVSATDGWHMNDKFPYKVTLTAPAGVTIDKTKLEKADAIVFNDHKIVFKIPYEVTSAGSHTIKAKINLAVCTGNQCVPHVQKLSWTVEGSEASGG